MGMPHAPTKRRARASAVGVVLILALLTLSGACIVHAGGNEPLVQPSDLQYLGAFRLPSGQFGASSFDYGGTGLAYNPANDSLFIVGHDWQQMVAEVKIPAVVRASQLNSLATATVLQPFADASHGLMYTVAPPGATIKVGGLVVHEGRLYGTAYVYYDATGSQLLSHFRVSSLNLATGTAEGMFKVGTYPSVPSAGFVSGYMTRVPIEWQAALGGPVITGQCCLSIISRTSFGPAAFSFDPTTLGRVVPAPATPLVYYSQVHFVNDWNVQSDFFNGSTQMAGAVFPDGTRSVLFLGRHGIGPFCYGTGGDCHDPTSAYQGTHAYPYVHRVWAYDVSDLAAVKTGLKPAWEVRPYAMWNLELPFQTESRLLGGVAWDAATRRLFVSQSHGDAPNPVIHVFYIAATGSSSTSPSAPTNLQVR